MLFLVVYSFSFFSFLFGSGRLAWHVQTDDAELLEVWLGLVGTKRHAESGSDSSVPFAASMLRDPTLVVVGVVGVVVAEHVGGLFSIATYQLECFRYELLFYINQRTTYQAAERTDRHGCSLPH